MVTLRDLVTATSGSIGWVSDNELALNGEILFGAPKGWCRVTNNRQGIAVSYRVARTGAAGRWLHDPTSTTLYPGKTAEHDGGTEWGVGTRLFDFAVHQLPKDEDGEWTGEAPTTGGVPPPDEAGGKTPKPAQPAWDWIEENIWLIVLLAIAAFVLWWLTLGGGLKGLL